MVIGAELPQAFTELTDTLPVINVDDLLTVIELLCKGPVIVKPPVTIQL